MPRGRSITPDQLRELRRLVLEEELTRAEAANRVGVSEFAVYKIASREGWPKAAAERNHGTPERFGLKPDAKPLAPRPAEIEAFTEWQRGDARYVAALAREMLRLGWIGRDAA